MHWWPGRPYPAAPQNEAQLRLFLQLTEGLSLPRSLSATGGLLLGRAYDFDLTRPGIGLFGGLPYAAARPGKAHAREVLSRPVGERIWFAGEALAGGLKQTAGGARLSGEAVAGKVALWLSHQDDAA